jgi:hypothetical protein
MERIEYWYYCCVEWLRHKRKKYRIVEDPDELGYWLEEDDD